MSEARAARVRHTRRGKRMQQITFTELLAQETKRDPIACAAHLREQGPLVRLTAPLGRGDGWIATGYDDAIAILKDPRFVKDIQKLAPSRDEQAPTNERASVMDRFLAFRRDMLSVDPPDHTRLRSLVSKAFTPRMIEQLRPRIQQIADELLDTAQVQGRMDLIADFAFPLPITVISEMLGIPIADRSRFRSWSQTIVTGTAGPEPEKAFATLAEFVQYIKTLLSENREDPCSYLVSSLVQS